MLKRRANLAIILRPMAAAVGRAFLAGLIFFSCGVGTCRKTVESLMRAFPFVFASWCTAVIVLVAGEAAQGAPDVLVLCPIEFRGALAEWQAYRTSQRHEIAVIAPSATAEQLSRRIQELCKSGQVKYLVRIGDA